MKRYVIIGSGPAGVTGAEAIRHHNPTGEVLILSLERSPFYYRTDLDLLVGGRMTLEQMFVHPPEFYKDRQIDVRLEQMVVAVHPERNSVRLSTGEEIEYDALLIAAGAKPIVGNWPGVDTEGVVTVRTLEDAQALVGRASVSRRAVVVGGGLVGLILAEALHRRGLELTLLVREPQLWWPVLDGPASDILRRKLEAEGNTVRTEEEVVEFVGEQALRAVKTSKGNVLEVDLAVVAIGVRPNVEFLRDTAVKVDRGVLVNEYLQSSIPNIYAAGDVAQAFDLVQHAHRVNTSWANAENQGNIAGTNMATSKAITFTGGIAANTEIVYGIPFTALGLTNPLDGSYQVLATEQKEVNIYRKLVTKDGRLVGALLVGRSRQVAKLQRLIEEGVDITATGEQLLAEA